MAIMDYGTNDAALSDPLSYLPQLYFHSGLNYSSIAAKTSSNGIVFSALSRNYTTWDDGDKCGCFITTAAVQSNEVDDGDFLNTLRFFRDTYMKSPDRVWMVERYYQTAPQLVDKIHRMHNSREVFKKIFQEYLSVAVDCIKRGNMEAALTIYEDMYNYVKDL
jgi:hypothetical protein